MQDLRARDWEHYDTRLGAVTAEVRDRLPDFLIVAPPRTGTTWLSDQLRDHPGIFIPAGKELRYFCTYWRWLDLSWYAGAFSAAPRGALKGEASPSYALLPERAVQSIFDLNPDLKLIFLMRDPVERAWSQLKHDHAGRAFNFASASLGLDRLEPPAVVEHFERGLSAVFGDYRACLERWRSVFPKPQMHLAFFDSFDTEPDRVLRDVCAFLDVSFDTDWRASRQSGRVNASLECPMPSWVRDYVAEAYHGRLRDLPRYLHDEWQLDVPPQWSAPIDQASGARTPRLTTIPSFCWDAQPSPKQQLDRFASEILRLYPLLVQQNMLGFNIVLYQCRFLALSQQLGPIDLTRITEGELDAHIAAGRCLVAPTLEAVRDAIELHASAVPLLLETGYRGFNLVAYRQTVYGLAQSLGPLDLASVDRERLDDWRDAGTCVIGCGRREARALIDARLAG